MVVLTDGRAVEGDKTVFFELRSYIVKYTNCYRRSDIVGIKIFKFCIRNVHSSALSFQQGLKFLGHVLCLQMTCTCICVRTTQRLQVMSMKISLDVADSELNLLTSK